RSTKSSRRRCASLRATRGSRCALIGSANNVPPMCPVVVLFRVQFTAQVHALTISDASESIVSDTLFATLRGAFNAAAGAAFSNASAADAFASNATVLACIAALERYSAHSEG